MDLLAQAAEGFRGIEADAALKEQALKFLHQWLTEADFTPYRPQLIWLLETKQWPGLLDRFYQILPFGTGGRRGAVGIGPNRMNGWTLRASVQGHCEYLKEQFSGVDAPRVVLAYDVRQFVDQRRQYNPELPNPVLNLSSRDLAQYAASVYVANGIHAHILPSDSRHYLATPELSFTIRYLQAHGGLNISASHNPPDDNGGKFYDERGGQPVPPEDQIMADLVDQVRVIKSLPWSEAQRSGRLHWLDETPHRAYIDLCRKQSLIPPPKHDDFKVVFTPLHGVGALTAMETLVEQGFRVVPVTEQMTPDGQFPNVTKTPNPEVPESMDRAAVTARANNADLVLATDPDADRLGAMVPPLTLPSPPLGGEGRVRGGEWHVITGNQIATLLTHFKLNKLTQQGRLPSSPIVVRTEVTTSQVTRIARHFKAQIVENLLVGFKYIADVLWHLDREGAYEDVTGTPNDFVIAVEESHGVLVTPHIRDKDAAGAALLMAELALDQKRRGQTVLDYLERLAREFGYFRNEGVSMFMRGLEGKQQMTRMLDRLRTTPPREIAGLTVTSVEDLRDEQGRFGPLKGATDAASRNVLIFRCGERARVVLRPSGTEPKAKIYLEACSPPRPSGMSDDDWRHGCQEVDALMKQLSIDFKRQALQLIGLDPSAVG
ncbi:MAG TPA: phospho-sugar mutase [Gemmataceae bacterium]|nr:phospho-sugar mutase [Gemmataceae bacterium]